MTMARARARVASLDLRIRVELSLIVRHSLRSMNVIRKSAFYSKIRHSSFVASGYGGRKSIISESMAIVVCVLLAS